ncbi:MAG TPA: isocitrate lyase/phosphoenolpyruvate mutase family protein [Thermoanaerobaculia bacterium]|jgi:phosphoenolpyruvate phosphomutase
MHHGAAQLRKLFDRPGIARVVGAHNALGAKMAERAGFDGVWSSSFEISASHAVPDASILGMTDHVAAARDMAAHVNIPIIADCDTGYGERQQFAHAVRQYEAAGIAAVCLEDKQFPKLNSFISGRQELASIDDFLEKLQAGKAAQRTADFAIIARTEALIAGCGRDEALLRARAYADAGADAVLIHSKAKTVDELASVARAWDRPTPLVAVPTTYFHVTANELASLGIKIVIYANQGLRSALRAMELVYDQILLSGSTAGVEDHLMPMKSIFELQGHEAEKQASVRVEIAK